MDPALPRFQELEETLISRPLAAMVERSIAQGKPKLVSDEAPADIAEKLRPFLKRGEKFREFIARTGLAAAQIRAMYPSEIANHIAVREADQENEPRPPIVPGPAPGPVKRQRLFPVSDFNL